MTTAFDFDFPVSDNWRAFYDNREGEDYGKDSPVGLDHLRVIPQLCVPKGGGQFEQRYFVEHIGSGEYNRDTAIRVAKQCLNELCDSHGYELRSWQAFRRAGEDSTFFWIRFMVNEGGYSGR